ncbi:transporter [bacterium]|nr:transporter [bacterium]
MKNLLKIAFFISIFCSAIFAQTFLPISTTPLDKFNYLYYTETGIPPRHLHPKIGLYYWNYSSSEFFDDDWNRDDDDIEYSESWVVPTFAFGAGDVIEFGMAVPMISGKIKSDISYDTYTLDGSGIGDMTLWLKTTVTQKPWFGIRTAVKLATGDDKPGNNKLPTGTGQTDLDMGFFFSYYPEKMGFLCDISTGYRLRFKKDIDEMVYIVNESIHYFPGGEYDPGDEGRLQLYLGGMPVEGFGVMFGGDGFISMNDRFGGDEAKKCYRASSMLGLRMFFRTKFGVRVDGGIKFDVAGKAYPAGLGFMLGANYEPKF